MPPHLDQAIGLRQRYRQKQEAQTGLTLYSQCGLRATMPGLKTQHPFVNAVYSRPLKNTALRLSRAIQDYPKSRKGKRKGANGEWLKFRSWLGRQSGFR